MSFRIKVFPKSQNISKCQATSSLEKISFKKFKVEIQNGFPKKLFPKKKF